MFSVLNLIIYPLSLLITLEPITLYGTTNLPVTESTIWNNVTSGIANVGVSANELA